MRNAVTALAAFVVVVVLMVPAVVFGSGGNVVGQAEATYTCAGPEYAVWHVPENPNRDRTAVITGDAVKVINDPNSRSDGSMFTDGVLLGPAPVEAGAEVVYPLPTPGTVTITGGDGHVSVTVQACTLVTEDTTTTTEPCNPNRVDCWCTDGVKFEPVDTPFVVPPGDWSLAVVKAGSEAANGGLPVHFVVYDPQPGDLLTHPTGKDISHVILCGDQAATTTTTTVPDTTSTVPPGDTTTTVPEDTTTTTVPDTTTSTTVPPQTPTTTTVPDATTTTTQPPTTTVPDTTAPPVECVGKTYYTHPDCPGYEE